MDKSFEFEPMNQREWQKYHTNRNEGHPEEQVVEGVLEALGAAKIPPKRRRIDWDVL